MSKHHYDDATIVIDDATLSTHTNECDVNLSRASDNVEGFQDAGKVILPGDRDDSVDLVMYQDYDNGEVHQTLSPLFESGEEFSLLITPFAGDPSPTNPGRRTDSAVILDYTPQRGKRGDVHTINVKIHVNGKFDEDLGES